MLEQGMKDTTARLRATIEEELGRFRQFKDLPAVEIEEMAARIVRAIAPFTGAVEATEAASRAA